MRIPDPQLNYHADRYMAQRIHAHGITFEQYLTDPAYFDALALQPEPLLPAQRTVAQAVNTESRNTGTHADTYGCACVCTDADACANLRLGELGRGEQCECLCHQWAKDHLDTDCDD